MCTQSTVEMVRFQGFPSHSSHCSGGLLPQYSGVSPQLQFFLGAVWESITVMWPCVFTGIDLLGIQYVIILSPMVRAKSNKKNSLWPKMASFGAPFLTPKFPRKCSYLGLFCCVLSQKMRPINLFPGAKMGRFSGGQQVYVAKVYVLWGQQVYVEKFMCFFSPLVVLKGTLLEDICVVSRSV